MFTLSFFKCLKIRFWSGLGFVPREYIWYFTDNKPSSKVFCTVEDLRSDDVNTRPGLVTAPSSPRSCHNRRYTLVLFLIHLFSPNYSISKCAYENGSIQMTSKVNSRLETMK